MIYFEACIEDRNLYLKSVLVMAMVFRGLSTCPLCDQVLQENETLELFPPFIGNTKDQLYVFNDAGVHAKCIEESPLGEKALYYREISINKTRPANRICEVSGNPVNKPQDWFYSSLLSSDETEKLSQFNFINLDLANVDRWVRRQEFLDTAKQFLQDGKWGSLTDYNVLERLIKTIEDR